MSISWGEIGVSAFSVLASAGVSVYISKRTAKAEIEKLRAIWAHEKEAACDSDFDAMVAAVSLYAKYPAPANFQSATNAVGIYRAKATDFNPRPPRGGRLQALIGQVPAGYISIHAPREGGDRSRLPSSQRLPKFQSTPPARGATDRPEKGG